MITRKRNDEGVSLIFSILLVTAIALVVTALLTQGQGSLRATWAVRSVADSSYRAEGAAQVALNNLRLGAGFGSNPNEAAFDNGDDAAGCFGNALSAIGDKDSMSLASSFYTSYGGLGANSAYIECAGESGTGAQGSPVPVTSMNKPGYAIVTLGGPITASSPLKVHGGIYSNSNINGTLTLDAGNAYAVGTCSGTTVAATATKNCSPSQAPIPDPGYVNELGGVVPGLQTPPTTCTSGVAVFNPGYYDDATALTTATKLCSVAWFKPGTYYFDFHNNGCANVCPANLFGSGTTPTSDVWTIDGNVVGGTPTNPTTGAVQSLPVTTWPTDSSGNPTAGTCQSPITSTSAVGVQFVFGNDSQVFMAKNSQLELCASYHSNRPPVVVYGLKTGATPTLASAVNLAPSGSPTTATTSGTGTWSASSGTYTWGTTGNGPKVGSITYGGFAPGSGIPAGSILTGATLKLTHSENDTADTATIQVTGAAAPAPTVAITKRAASTADSIDLTTQSSVFNALQAQVHDNGFSGASVAFATKITQNGNKSDTIGGVSLSLQYYVPVLRGEAGTCVQTGTGGCTYFWNLLQTGNNKIVLYFQGTTYVPYGDMNFTLSNFSAEVAKFGIVARQLEFAINNGNPRYHGPVFEIPDDSPGYGYNSTIVDINVYLCNSATCTSSSTNKILALVARAQLWDNSGAPVAGDRGVNILSWSEQR